MRGGDRFFSDEPGDVLMLESVIILQAICSHGKHKVIAEKVRIDFDDEPSYTDWFLGSSIVPVRELSW